MPRYTAFDPNTEIIGAYVLSFTTNLNQAEMEPIVKKHGLENADPQKWYPQQAILDMLSDIVDANNAATNLVAIGIAVGEQSYKLMPPQVQSLSLLEFFNVYEKVYPERHRNGDVGYVKIEPLNDRHIKIRIRTAYPDDLFYGLFYSYSRLFSKGQNFTLEFDHSVKQREAGGEETVLLLDIE